MAAAIALIFFYAPLDEDGLNQKIFYFHVPIAFTAYACFGWGGWKALRHLWKGDESADLESYVAIHLGVIFGALTCSSCCSSSTARTSCCATRLRPGRSARI
jgi:heme exporter protein C